MPTIITLILLISSIPLFANSGDFRTISTRFLCLHGEPEKFINLDKDGIPSECQLIKNIITRPQLLTVHNNRLSLLNEASKEESCSIKIPSNTSSVILIFIASKGTQTNTGWYVHMIDDAEKNFPAGGAYLANFHKQEIRCIIGEHRAKLKPGETKGLPRPKERNEFNMARVAFQFMKGSEWVTAKETGIRFTSKKRHLLISYVEPESGRPRVTSYQVFAYPPPKKKKN